MNVACLAWGSDGFFGALAATRGLAARRPCQAQARQAQSASGPRDPQRSRQRPKRGMLRSRIPLFKCIYAFIDVHSFFFSLICIDSHRCNR